MEIVALLFIVGITLLGMAAIPVSIKKGKMEPGAGVVSLGLSILTLTAAFYLYVN